MTQAENIRALIEYRVDTTEALAHATEFVRSVGAIALEEKA